MVKNISNFCRITFTIKNTKSSLTYFLKAAKCQFLILRIDFFIDASKQQRQQLAGNGQWDVDKGNT